jgi:hypothetical protein
MWRIGSPTPSYKADTSPVGSGSGERGSRLVGVALQARDTLRVRQLAQLIGRTTIVSLTVREPGVRAHRVPRLRDRKQRK